MPEGPILLGFTTSPLSVGCVAHPTEVLKCCVLPARKAIRRNSAMGVIPKGANVSLIQPQIFLFIYLSPGDRYFVYKYRILKNLE